MQKGKSRRVSELWRLCATYLLKRQGYVLPTGCALPELAPTQPAKMAPFQAGANNKVRGVSSWMLMNLWTLVMFSTAEGCVVRAAARGLRAGG